MSINCWSFTEPIRAILIYNSLTSGPLNLLHKYLLSGLVFLKRHLSFCSGWNIFCHILLSDQFCRILCQSYNLSIVEQLYYIKWKCLQYLRKTFFTLNPIQNFLSCVCKHRFLKKLSNIWTLSLLHSASKWAIYAEVGSSVWILSSPHMQNLQSAGSI